MMATRAPGYGHPRGRDRRGGLRAPGSNLRRVAPPAHRAATEYQPSGAVPGPPWDGSLRGRARNIGVQVVRVWIAGEGPRVVVFQHRAQQRLGHWTLDV